MSQSNNSANNNNKTILCIPGVFPNIKEDRIRRIFTDLDLGNVTRIDIVLPKNNSHTNPTPPVEKKQFNRVFVHIEWNQTPHAATCRRKLSEGKEVKIVYDEPWFWKVSAYRPPAPKEPPKPKVFQPKKARLEIEDDEEAKFDPNINYSGVIASGLPEPPKIPDIIEEKHIAAAIQYDENEKEIVIENLNYSTLSLPSEPPKKKRAKPLVNSDKPSSK